MASANAIFKQEEEIMGQLLEDIQHAIERGDAHDATFYNRWAAAYYFVGKTRELIKNKEVRDWCKLHLGTVTGLPPEFQIIMKEPLRLFCERLAAIEPIDEIPACAKPVAPTLLPPSAYETIGSGGYGAVFQPALPNVVDRKSVNYPGNVTKAFYRKHNADALLAKRNVIRTVMGENEGHRISPYTYQYTAGKLPGRLFTKMLGKNPLLAANTPLHLVRMPHLGIDLGYIMQIYKEIRKVPIGTILEQFQKLFHQTASLAAHKYIHGDIRTLNVMIQPKTGVMTIIDFDWLLPYREFVERFKFGFYNNPPEYTLFDVDFSHVNPDVTVTQLYRMISTDPNTINKIYKYIDDHIQGFPNVYGSVPSNNVVNSVWHGIVDAVKYYNTRDLTLGRSAALQTFDNFALAVTLLDFMRPVYVAAVVATDASTDEEIKEDMRIRFPHLTEPELAAAVPALRETVKLLREVGNMKVSLRPTPAQAAERMDAIVAKYKDSLIETNSGAELGRLAVLMGNLSALRPEASPAAASPEPAGAINNNVRAELNRMRALHGALPSLPSSNTRRGRRTKKARKTYRRRR